MAALRSLDESRGFASIASLALGHNCSGSAAKRLYQRTARIPIPVGSSMTDASGELTVIYVIPAYLRGQTIIAIRLESPTSGYYAYNWFLNE